MTPPRRSQTFLGNLSQAVKTVHTKINFSKLKLKPNARVPELWVEDPDNSQVYPLLGDRYILGRSSKQCDIVVQNPVVSQVHLTLLRQRPNRRVLGLPARRHFELRDENSTNGIYRGQRKVKTTVLHHGDQLSLGPPELAAAVRIRFLDPTPWYLKAVRYGLLGLSGVAVLLGLIVAIEWSKIEISPLPQSVQGPVIVYSRDGQTPLRPPHNRIHAEMRQLSDYSAFLPKAVIASEDSRYYWHLGVDPIGTLRALVTNIRGGEIREGGSTLTQQLARNLLRKYVGDQDSAGRKLREAVVALKLETTYSKDFLMLTYLNRVYLGSGNYGFEDAAQFYFGKPAKDLNLSEAATLAGILPAPNSFNPVRNYQAAIEYRDRVISRMAELGMVSADDAQRARRSRIDISPKAKEELESTIAPYYYDHVFSELDQLLGARLAQEGNFVVETGLDIAMQAKAERALRNTVANVGSASGFDQGAIVTLDFSTGDVLALVGGVDYQASQYNRATQASRQPGSTFKVFAYTAALERGVSPDSAYSCAPLNWGGQEFAGCRIGGGSLDLATAVAQSENVVALRVGQEVGLDAVVNTARKMGIQSQLQAVPGLILGQSGVNLLELTGAYGVLANRGLRNSPHTINRILDTSECGDRSNFQTCRVIYPPATAAAGEPVIPAAVADTMTTFLQGVVSRGTGRSAALGLGEAGKTGTTNDNIDLLYIGYIPSRNLVSGIWLGNDNNTPTNGSSALAAKLWGDYMGAVVR
jgi:penicillin-binding protein 1A